VEKRNAEELARLPDPDAACDYLPPAVLEAPAEEDRKQLMEVEEAIDEKDDALELLHHEDRGDLPSSLLAKAPSQPGS
jgi:hypothetical protein